MKYDVRREHLGDKLYSVGDEREANPNDVAHLVKNGVLVEKKAKEAPKNKARIAPKNKAAK